MTNNYIDKPVFILAAPRSGSTLLFETLMQAPSLWNPGHDSYKIFESIPELQPGKGVKDNRLTAKAATKDVIELLHERLIMSLRDRDGIFFTQQARQIDSIRVLEKTNRNSLRIPFLNVVFPNCLFIFLYRCPRDNVSSIIEAWRSGRFVSYHDIFGTGQNWSLLLPPNWSKMKGKSLETIAAYQWKAANKFIINDLEKIPSERWTTVTYSDLVEDQGATIIRLCEFIGVPVDEVLRNVIGRKLKLSEYTLSPPQNDKWLKNARELDRVLPGLKGFERRAERVISLRCD